MDQSWLYIVANKYLVGALTANRRVLTESLITIESLASGTYLENSGQVVMEAEHFTDRVTGVTHEWLLKTNQSGYTGTSYLQVLPDLDTLYQTGTLTAGPRAEYAVDFTTPNTYTVWLRGYPTNAAGDSVYVELGDEQVEVTGFTPGVWSWASTTTSGVTATLSITTTGVQTVSVAMREDGLRIDRLLLTTDTTYIPTEAGPAETDRQLGSGDLIVPLTRTIAYTYDNLYRLTEADYSTGENYQYSYDPVGNRLQQIIDGDTTAYLYDAANRLVQVDGQSYTFDDNGNLLQTGVMTNSWDAANRLVESSRDGATIEPIYNGVNDRVAQTVGLSTTYYALDVQGLPEVIYTSEGNVYLHLPGVIVAENSEGETRYLLSDGLGSIRQAMDENGEVVAYNEFDPYGNPIDNNGGDPYGYTGEWWESDVNLLHLRARWYLPETGTFLSVDPVESEPPYQYARGNPVNYVDPSGRNPGNTDPGNNYPPPECRTTPTKFIYRDCVLKHYNLEPIEEWWLLTDEEENLIEGTPGCDLGGPVLYRGPGYVEGDGVAGVYIRWGREFVYDFATMQKARFSYDGGYPFSEGWGGLSDGFVGVSYMKYIGTIEGFRSPGAGNIESDYSEVFYTFSGGLDAVIASGGFLDARTPDGKITSRSIYVALGLSRDPIPIANIDGSHVYYTMDGDEVNYAHNGKVDRLGQLLNDIDAGNDIYPAPHPSTPGYNWTYNLPLVGPGPKREKAKQTAIRMAKVYEEIHSAYE